MKRRKYPLKLLDQLGLNLPLTFQLLEPIHFFSLATLCCQQDLSSLTRDQTHACSGGNHWTTGKSRNFFLSHQMNWQNWFQKKQPFHTLEGRKTWCASGFQNTVPGVSLVAQWRRIHLPMRETWIWSLISEDPCAVEQLSPSARKQNTADKQDPSVLQGLCKTARHSGPKPSQVFRAHSSFFQLGVSFHQVWDTESLTPSKHLAETLLSLRHLSSWI